MQTLPMGLSEILKQPLKLTRGRKLHHQNHDCPKLGSLVVLVRVIPHLHREHCAVHGEGGVDGV